MTLQLGSTYGLIGVEVCDERGHVLLVVNRIEANRLAAEREQREHPRHGQSVENLDREIARLEATKEPALEFARELAKRWNAGESA